MTSVGNSHLGQLSWFLRSDTEETAVWGKLAYRQGAWNSGGGGGGKDS